MDKQVSTNRTKSALGRGLRSLIPESPRTDETPQGNLTGLSHIEIQNLVPGSAQPRQLFDEQAIHELSKSILEYGVLQPLVVRRLTERQFEIIAGERRWRAAKAAGLNLVPCVVSDVTTDDALKVALVENLQREDLNAIEEAEGYLRLSEELGLSHDQIAQSVGKDRSTVANTMRLLKLPPSVRDLVVGKRVSMGHARALLSIRDEEQIEKVANQIAREGLSVRATERIAQNYVADANASIKIKKKLNSESIQERSVRRRLEAALGTKVEIKSHKGKGAVILHFSDINQLNDLIDKIAKEY